MKTTRAIVVINLAITILVLIIPNSPHNDPYQAGLIIIQSVLLGCLLWRVVK